MEVFTLLKFWRNATGETNITDFDVRNRPPDTDNDDDSFFDLILTAPNSELNTTSNNNVTTKNNSNISSTTTTTASVHIQSRDNDTNHKKNKNNSSKRDGEATTKSNDPPHHSDSFSIRKKLPIESVSKPQSPISLLRSPPKFRVLMLSFRKSPSTSTATITTPDHTSFRKIKFVNDPMSTPKRERSKRFGTRHDDVVHEIPLATLLGRDNSLRSKFQKEKSAADLSKGVVYKYFKMIKPLYARASKIRIFDTATAAEEKHGSSSRAVFRNLIKSRMAAAAAGGGGGPAPVRRDDSVLQQQDGIQGAILHCKRSYSSSSSSSVISQDCAMMLSRSASDSSSMQRAFNQPRRSAEEETRSSI